MSSEPQESSADAGERERLLAATRQVLDRNGWWGFKVDTVLKQAGLSTRSFYRHFDKKDDLLAAVLDEELSDIATRLHAATSGAATGSDKVRAYVTTTIDITVGADGLGQSSSHPLIAANWREMIAEYPDTVEHCTEKLIAPLTAAIESGRAAGEFDSEDPATEARTIFYMLWSMTADLSALATQPKKDEFERTAMDFVTRALRMSDTAL